MSLLRKTMLGMIGISSIFAANPGAAFAPLGAGMIVIGAAIGIGMFASAGLTLFSLQSAASLSDVWTSVAVLQACRATTMAVRYWGGTGPLAADKSNQTVDQQKKT